MGFALSMAGWLLALVIGVPLLVFTIELLVGLLPGSPPRSRAAVGNVAMLIPAHNESGGIAAMLDALRQVAPQGTRILVVADNCSDETAAIARGLGAEVIERSHDSERGKGYALAFGRDHLAQSPAGAVPDVVIVLDADCRLSPGSIAALSAQALESGAPAQAINLISPDLAGPPLVQIGSFAMVVKNLYRSRGMQRMGGAALLTGTGMAFPWRLLANAKLATGALVEDLALGIELTREGHSPRLCPAAQVRSAPAAMGDAMAQRTRWEHGFLSTLKSLALPVLASGMRRFSRAELLLGLHLLVPPLALLLLLGGAMLPVLALLWGLGASVGPLLALALALGGALLAALLGWLGRGKEFLSAAALLRAPLYVLWKIPIYLKFLRNPETRWNRTRRSNEGGE